MSQNANVLFKTSDLCFNFILYGILYLYLLPSKVVCLLNLDLEIIIESFHLLA